MQVIYRNRIYQTLLLLCLGAIGLILSGTLSTTAQSESFDRSAMLEDMIADTILPLHQTLADESTLLVESATAFQNDPTEDTLTDFQSAWHATSIAFEHIQVYSFSRTLPYLTQLDSSPPNIAIIERYITDEVPIDADLIASVGSSLKGLPALEYLIFGDGVLTLLDENPIRIAYAVALAGDIQRVADELVEQWTIDAGGYGDRFLNADGDPESVRSSMSMLSNEIIAEIEILEYYGLAIPLGYDNAGEPQPDLVEAPYSQSAIEKLIANMEGVQYAFNGLGDSSSLADYLDFLGASSGDDVLSDALNAQIQTVIDALQAIELPLAQAIFEDAEAVANAYEESRTLVQILKTDMAVQLGITVTFSDSDGD